MKARWRNVAGAVGLRLPVPALMWWSVWTSTTAGQWMVWAATAALSMVLLSTLNGARTNGPNPGPRPKYTSPRA